MQIIGGSNIWVAYSEKGRVLLQRFRRLHTCRAVQSRIHQLQCSVVQYSKESGPAFSPSFIGAFDTIESFIRINIDVTQNVSYRTWIRRYDGKSSMFRHVMTCHTINQEELIYLSCLTCYRCFNFWNKWNFAAKINHWIIFGFTSFKISSQPFPTLCVLFRRGRHC